MFNIKSLLGLDYYTSPLDEFLKEFDSKNHKLSASQRKEIKKYSRIYKLRNDKNYSEPKNQFWDKF